MGSQKVTFRLYVCNACDRLDSYNEMNRTVAFHQKEFYEGNKCDFVQSGDVMPRPNFTSIHIVVAEVIIGDIAVFKANQAIAFNTLFIEVNLNFGIFPDHLQGATQIVDEELFGFIDGVDVSVEALVLYSSQTCCRGRYWIASARCGDSICSAPAKSAMVRASLRIR